MGVLDDSVVRIDGPWQHRDVSANAARFHVATSGEGPLVLFLHGFPEFWWAWRHQMTAVAAAGYRTAAMDLRGYGASDKPPRGYDPFTLSADVAGVIRSLGARDAVVVGHGWGGFLAWATAVNHPRVVRRLAVVSTPHPRRLRSALTTDLDQLRRGLHFLSPQLPWLPERRLVRDDAAIVGDLLREWGRPGWPDATAEACYREAMRIPGVAHCSLEYVRWAVRSLPRPDGLRFAHRMGTAVRVPTLQLHGALDRTYLPRTAEGSGRFVDGPYRWRLLDGAGHFPHEETPDLVTAELLDWLSEPESP